MNRVTLLVAAALAIFIAEPVSANGFNPMMLAGMVGPMMHGIQPHPYGYEPHQHRWGPGYYRPPLFRRPPVFIEHHRPPFIYGRPEVIEGGGYGPVYGGYGGGYEGEYGGEHFQSFHIHTEHVHIEHFHEEMERIHRKTLYSPPVIVHAHSRRVYAHRTCCNCCCNRIAVRYAPMPAADPLGDPSEDPSEANTELTQSDLELLQSAYK